MIKTNYVNFIALLSIFCLFTSSRNLTAHNEPLRIYQEKFRNVLLVINFNHPYYDNIEFIKNLYSPIFKNIVFYGERAHPQVHKVNTGLGYFLHEVLEHALTEFPNYDGYLILQDDCILNFWNYLSYDLDKIWLAVRANNQRNLFFSIRNANGTCTGDQTWIWWPIYFEAVWNAHAKFNTQELYFLQKNVGEDNIPGIWCDLFYIPGRFRDATLRLSELLKKVFCEIAIPTMLCSLDLIENWEQLRMDWRWGHNFTIKNYPRHASWVHPIKFSKKENRDMITQIFNQILS